MDHKQIISALNDICGDLDAAVAQSIPTDDQIIMSRVHAALTRAKGLRTRLKTADHDETAAAPAMFEVLETCISYILQNAKDDYRDLTVESLRIDDDLWRECDPEGFALYERARAALAQIREAGR